MGFLEETGNAGAAAAAQGIADGLERGRLIDEANFNRQMAMKEQDMRRAEHTAALDQMAHQREMDLQSQDYNRLRLGLQQQQQDLRTREFDFLVSERRDEIERESKRSEAMVLVQRIFEDDTISSDEWESLLGLSSVLDPQTLNRVFGEARSVRARIRAKEAEDRANYINAASLYVIENKAATEAEVLLAKNQAYEAGQPEIYEEYILRKQEQAIKLAGQRASTAEFVAATRNDLSQRKALQDLRFEDQQQAHVFLREMEELSKVNPGDPKIAEIRDQVRVLMLDPVSRKERFELQQTVKDLEYLRERERANMGPVFQAVHMAFDEVHRTALEQAIGPEVAHDDKRAYENFRKEMALAAIHQPTRPVPIDEAMPGQMRYAFQTLVKANTFLPDMDPQVRQEHVNNIFRRAWIEPSPEALASFQQWLSGDTEFVDREPDSDEIQAWNLKHAIQSKETWTEQRDEALRVLQRTRKLNKIAEEHDLPTVPLNRKHAETLSKRRASKDPVLERIFSKYRGPM